MGSLGCSWWYHPCFPRCWFRTHESQKARYFHFCRMGRCHDRLHRHHYFCCLKRICLLCFDRSLRSCYVHCRLENWINCGDSPYCFHWLILPCQRYLTLCWRIPIRNWASKGIRKWNYWLVIIPKDILWISRWYNWCLFHFCMVPNQKELKIGWV